MAMINQELIDYIAQSQDDMAQRIREATRGALDSLASTALAFEAWSRRFDHRHMMRRKIRRMLHDAE